MIYGTPISPLGFCQDVSKIISQISLNVFKLCSLRFATRFDKKKNNADFSTRFQIEWFSWILGCGTQYFLICSRRQRVTPIEIIYSHLVDIISVDSDHQVDTLSLKFKVDNRPLINTKQTFSFSRNNGIKQLECNIKRKPGSPIVDQQASRHYPHSLKDRQ